MSTDSSSTTTPNPTPQPPGPAHPAKGNKRGQKSLAAKIVRWQRLGTNLSQHIDQLPLFKDQFTQFQAMLDEAESLVSQLDVSRANTDDLMARRNQMLAGGDDLYRRLDLALRAIHGPGAGRLREFGLKPHRPAGRSKKKATPVPPPPQQPEAPTAHPAAVPPTHVAEK